MLPIKPVLKDFMIDDEKAVVTEYERRVDFVHQLRNAVFKLARAAGRLPHDRQRTFIQEGVAIFLKSGQGAPADFTGLEIDVRVDNSNHPNHFNVSVENPEVRPYLEIPAELSERHAQILKAAEERYLTHVYTRTGILKNNYPCSVLGLTAEQARANGWVPEGYELVPVEMLDVLSAPGFNDEGFMEDQEFNNAAVLAQDILLERAKLLGGS